MKKVVSLLVVAVLSLLWVGPASATWSVVGIDQTTGEVGVAIASCVPADALGNLDQPLVPVVVVPNTGAAVTQAALNPAAAVRIRELVAIDRTPEEIIANIVSDEFDPDSALRQHAVVTFAGQPAGFTGNDNSPVALDRQSAGVSVQGNILVSESVVTDALAAFESLPDAPLAERLLAALVAGSEVGGDSRCGEQTALFAHLVVAGPDDDPLSPSILLTIAREPGDGNPVGLLDAAYLSGKRQHVDVSDSAGPGPGGRGVGAVALVLGVLMIPAAVWYWRWAYRKPRY